MLYNNNRHTHATTPSNEVVKMKKALKIIVVLFCIFLIAVVCAAFVLKSIFTEEKIKGYIDDAARTYIGREIKYEKLSFSFVGINLRNFAISENAAFEQGTFAKIDRFAVKVEFFPLLRKEIRIKRIIIDGFEIKAVKNEEGKYNFDDITERFAVSSEEDKEADSEDNITNEQKILPPDITLEKLIIKNSNLLYSDILGKTDFSFNDINAFMERFSFSRPFICNIKLNFNLKDDSISILVPFEAVVTANLKNMDLAQANLNVTSLKADFEDMNITGKASVNNFEDPVISAEVSVFSVTNNTLKQFAADLPDFVLSEARFDANVALSDMKSASVNIDSLYLEVEDMKLDAKASLKDLTMPKINMNANIESFTNNTLKHFSKDLPEFAVRKAAFNSKIDLDITNEKAVLENASLDVSGGSAKINGNIGWGKELTYDIKADVNFALDILSEMLPEIAKTYNPKGKISAEAAITQNSLKADIKTENVGFKFDPVFNADKINTELKIDSLDNIKLTNLSGLFNDMNFKGNAEYLKTKTALNVKMNFDMDALILKAFPETGETPAGGGSGSTSAPQPQQKTSSSLPLNLTADLKVGAVKIPYFNSDKGAEINVKMTGITDKLDKTNGNMKFNIYSGNIEDADKLAKSNEMTKIVFGVVALVDSVVKSLNIDSLTGINNKDGIGYDNFDGDLDFVNGKMTIRKMDFVSKAVSVKTSGTTDFQTDKVDIKASIQPGVNKPVIMKITGTTSNPKGSIDIAASVTSIFGKEIDAMLNKNKKDTPKSSSAPAGASSSTSTAVTGNPSKNAKPGVSDIMKSLDAIFNKKDNNKK